MKKRVECKLEKELVYRLDSVAELLKTNRTDVIKGACVTYLKRLELGHKNMQEMERGKN